MNKKSTKRALVLSILSLMLCVSMLVGSTMAWFTDNATASVNKIQSGKLDVTLEMWDGEKWVNAEGKTLGFVDGNNKPITDAILWEPGCRYLLQPFRIVNSGDLALKFDVVVAGIDGDTKLAEAIEYGRDINNPSFVASGNLNDFNSLFDAIENPEYDFNVLEPSESMDTLEDGITFHMKETAGNEYQGLSISGVAITVRATQATVEEDSYNNQYDKDAEYKDISVWDGETKDTTWFDASSGEFVLTDAAQLAGIADLTSTQLNGKTITLGADMAMNGASFNEIFPGYAGSVVFDGKGYVISNVKVGTHNVNGMNNVGMFGSQSSTNITIKNLTIDGVTVEGTADVNYGSAILVGYNEGDVTIENVTIKNANVDFGNVKCGLFVGYSTGNVTLKNCTVENSTTGGRYSNVMVGQMNSGKTLTIDGCTVPSGFGYCGSTISNSTVVVDGVQQQ